MSFGQYLIMLLFFLVGMVVFGIFGVSQIAGSIASKMFVNKNVLFFAYPSTAIKKAKSLTRSIVLWSVIITAATTITAVFVKKYSGAFYVGIGIGAIISVANSRKYIREFVDSCGGFIKNPNDK